MKTRPDFASDSAEGAEATFVVAVVTISHARNGCASALYAVRTRSIADSDRKCWFQSGTKETAAG